MKTDNTIYLIGRIREKSHAFLLKELEQIGLRDIAPSHGDILATLIEHKELPMTEIANKIHRDRSTVTALVNKLMRQGYVSSRKDPEDNRSTIIFLTQKGKELEPSFREISKKLNEIEYKGITSEEKEILQKILERINENF